jgi:glutathione-regulated potassium-efflux system ancillary protein KefG
MSRRILIQFAHPSQHRSEINLPLARASAGVDGVTLVDLYAEYPDYCIDIEREQERLRRHDIVVFMFPLYWYSTPSILKEWQDLVLEYGFAYGHDGNALHGKRMLCAISAGGDEHAYRSSGYNHYSLRELLRPLEQTATLCGMVYLPPYSLFGSRTALEDGKLSDHIERWLQILGCLRHGQIDLDRATSAEKLDECVELAGGNQR